MLPQLFQKSSHVMGENVTGQRRIPILADAVVEMKWVLPFQSCRKLHNALIPHLHSLISGIVNRETILGSLWTASSSVADCTSHGWLMGSATRVAPFPSADCRGKKLTSPRRVLREDAGGGEGMMFSSSAGSCKSSAVP